MLKKKLNSENPNQLTTNNQYKLQEVIISIIKSTDF